MDIERVLQDKHSDDKEQLDFIFSSSEAQPTINKIKAKHKIYLNFFIILLQPHLLNFL